MSGSISWRPHSSCASLAKETNCSCKRPDSLSSRFFPQANAITS